jgi:hypothetical protein
MARRCRRGEYRKSTTDEASRSAIVVQCPDGRWAKRCPFSLDRHEFLDAGPSGRVGYPDFADLEWI